MKLALVVLALGFALTFWGGPWGDESISDLHVYDDYGEAFTDGDLPYRDIGFEYPPLAAPVLAAPALVGDGFDDYRVGFAVMAFLMAVAAVALTGALASATNGDRRIALFACAALLPLTCGALLRTRFDLAPMVLTLLALWLLLARHPRAGFAVLGVAAGVKLFPLVVVPIAFAWLWGRGEERAALEGGAILAVVLAVVAIGGLALSADGFRDSFEYHLDRPIQVESAPSFVLRGLDDLGLGEATPLDAYKSDGLVHDAGDTVSAAFAAVFLGLLVLLALAARNCAVAYARTGVGDDGRALVLCALTALAGFAALGKVLSPQFLIWVVPLCALALAWGMRWLAATSALACALTLVEFPKLYDDLVDEQTFPLLVVAARDALLIAAVVLAARAVLASNEGRPAPAR